MLTGSADDIRSEFGWPHAPTALSTIQPQPSQPKPELAGFLGELTALIRRRGEPLLDELIVATGKSAPELLPTLMVLELQGVIHTLPSGRYAAN